MPTEVRDASVGLRHLGHQVPPSRRASRRGPTPRRQPCIATPVAHPPRWRTDRCREPARHDADRAAARTCRLLRRGAAPSGASRRASDHRLSACRIRSPRRVGRSGLVTVARWTLIVAGGVAVGPVVATLLLRQIAITTPWAVAYVAASPFVPVAGLAALVLFVLARSWIGVAVGAALTAVLLVTQVPLYLGSAAPTGPTSELTVMTVNLHFGLGDAADIVDTVRREGVELLAVQELDHGALAALEAAGLEDVLQHAWTRPDGGAAGNGLWSRYPLDPLPRRSGFGHPPVAATMDLHGLPVFVAAVHAVSPYPDDTARWSSELDELADWLGEVDGPAVVAGDFNATLDHPQFRDVLATGYRDAAEQAGAGFLPTFPANRRRLPLLITIDHVLAQRRDRRHRRAPRADRRHRPRGDRGHARRAVTPGLMDVPSGRGMGAAPPRCRAAVRPGRHRPPADRDRPRRDPPPGGRRRRARRERRRRRRTRGRRHPGDDGGRRRRQPRPHGRSRAGAGDDPRAPGARCRAVRRAGDGKSRRGDGRWPAGHARRARRDRARGRRRDPLDDGHDGRRPHAPTAGPSTSTPMRRPPTASSR